MNSAPGKAPTHSSVEAQHRLAYFSERRDEIVSTIRELVEIESPSDNKAAVDRIAEAVAHKFSQLDGELRVHPAKDFGNHLQIDFDFAGKSVGKSAAKPVLLLGHYDTVYPMGTLATMPCRVVDNKLTGPGVLDMKSGIVLMLHALAALQEWHGKDRDRRLPRPVTVLLVSDEEVGSESSRMITESLAKKAAAVLVLEPSYGRQGAVKTARKGVGEYLVKVTGKASHAGLDFQKGVNAILELARQIEKISGFSDLKKGLTVNVGIVGGGSRTNVVPAEAAAQIDVRIARMKDSAGIDKKMRSLRPFNRKCKIEPASLQSQMQNRDHRRNQSSADGTYRRSGSVIRAGRGHRARVGMEAWRSGGRRRFRWQFHRGSGDSNPGRSRRRGRRSARHARAHPDLGVATPRRAYCWPDRGRVIETLDPAAAYRQSTLFDPWV